MLNAMPSTPLGRLVLTFTLGFIKRTGADATGTCDVDEVIAVKHGQPFADTLLTIYGCMCVCMCRTAHGRASSRAILWNDAVRLLLTTILQQAPCNPPTSSSPSAVILARAAAHAKVRSSRGRIRPTLPPCVHAPSAECQSSLPY